MDIVNFVFNISYISFLISYSLFLISYFSFLIPHFLFLIPHSSFLIPYFSFPVPLLPNSKVCHASVCHSTPVSGQNKIYRRATGVFLLLHPPILFPVPVRSMERRRNLFQIIY